MTEKEKFIDWFEEQANAKYCNANFPETVCSFIKKRLFDVLSDDFFKDLNDFIETPKLPNPEYVNRKIGQVVVTWDTISDKIFIGAIQEFNITADSKGLYSLKNNSNFSVCPIKFKSKQEVFDWFIRKMFLG